MLRPAMMMTSLTRRRGLDSAYSAGVPALTTNLRVAKLVPELTIATAVSPQFQRRDMAVAVVPIMARPYRPAGSLLRGDQLPVVGQTTHLGRLALRLDVHGRVTQPQIGQRDTAPGPRQLRGHDEPAVRHMRVQPEEGAHQQQRRSAGPRLRRAGGGIGHRTRELRSREAAEKFR